ncbi:DNA polymerase I [compost metagenome]
MSKMKTPQRPFASSQPAVSPTGRLVNSTPVLQNIPIRTEEGRRIREAFLPALPGRG